MKNVIGGFREFLLRQNMIALAVGVVLGAAVGKLVTGIVDDLVMPVVGLLLPAGDWRSAQWVLSGDNAIKYGDLVGRLLDFTIVAFVVFVAVRYIFSLEKKPEPVAMKTCAACLETIPAAARRCRACGESQVEPTPRGRPLEPVRGT